MTVDSSTPPHAHNPQPSITLLTPACTHDTTATHSPKAMQEQVLPQLSYVHGELKRQAEVSERVMPCAS